MDVSPLKKIVISVVAVHFLVIFNGFLHLWLAEEAIFIRPQRKMVVSTIQLSPKKPISPAAAPVHVAAAAVPKPRQAPPSPPKKTPAPPQPAAPQRNQQLIAQAKEKMGKIAQTSTPSKQSYEGQKPLGALKMQAVCSLENHETATTYHEQLGQVLHDHVQLPEYGDVKIRLVVHKSGKVVRMTIESSQSLVNSRHIEARISKLQFPPFGTTFGGINEKSFLITLTNETSALLNKK